MKTRLISFLVPLLLLAAIPALSQTTSSISNLNTTNAGQNQISKISTINNSGKQVLQNAVMSRQRLTGDCVIGQPGAATVIIYAANGISNVIGQLTVGYDTTPGTTAGVSEVDTLTIGGTPTGGTFTITYGGLTTAAITWSATNATLLSNINTAVRALANVGGTNITATAASLTAGIGTIALTFSGTLATTTIPVLAMATGTSLTGTSPTTVITQTTVGSPFITGGVTIQDGSGNVIFDVPILTSGVTVIPFHVPSRGSPNAAMIVTLTAPGSTIRGYLDCAHWSE